MRRLLTCVVLAAAIASPALAQQTGVVHETMTVTSTAGGFADATIAALGRRSDASCRGVLESGPIRYAYDGSTPTSTVGSPASIGQVFTIEGLANVQNFRAIRTTGSNGSIYWTCSK